MKNLFILSVLFLGITTYSQKYFTNSGTVHFEASVPVFEDVDATNKTVVTVLNADSGDIATIAMVRKFKFKVALMEEHFNENYAESSTYPKITFSGKILNFKKENLTTARQQYTVSGILNFHGTSNKINSTASIYTADGKIYLEGKFIAKPADYKITIPKMVTKKIAENVKIDYNFELIRQ